MDRIAMAKKCAQMALAAWVASGTVACGASTQDTLPLSTSTWKEPKTTLIWLGTGAAYRAEGDGFQRTPEFDYEFSVVQRRYGDRWESTKELHRRHPDYDGSAGPRDQTYHFTIQFGAPQGDAVAFEVDSTLGNGTGTTDRQFRKAQIELHPDISSLAPFNMYRLEQDYRYERGSLVETVSLVKRGDDGEKLWVKTEEEARLYAQHSFEGPPTEL